MATAGVTRKMHNQHQATPPVHQPPQIFSLRERLRLIRDTQRVAISSLLLSIVATLLLFSEATHAAKAVFTNSLLLLLAIALALVALQVATQRPESRAGTRPAEIILSCRARFANRRLRVLARRQVPGRRRGLAAG